MTEKYTIQAEDGSVYEREIVAHDDRDLIEIGARVLIEPTGRIGDVVGHWPAGKGPDKPAYVIRLTEGYEAYEHEVKWAPE